ncbi:MAG: hypothetical protein IJV50_11410 [Lachnospiraceae bacterium]|nr:hypothetical protein [Lachnospiraceae bacterium]
MVKKIYFDMDGVLADFDRGVEELCGIPRRNQETVDEAQDNQMWEAIRQISHFYDQLAPMPGALDMFWALYHKYGDQCEILTGIPKAKRGIATAGEDKISWVHRVLTPDIKVNVVYKEEKKNYCTGPECVLIDDFSENIKAWENDGGTGILHKNAKETVKKLETMGIL